MSNNFELLTELERTATIFRAPDTAPAESLLPKSRLMNDKLPSTYSEAVNLVHRVFLGKPESAPHVVVFAGAQSGAGCSWVCAHAAEALADRVPGAACILDANIQSPAMHQHFRLNNQRGLIDSLFETAPVSDYVQQVQDRQLSVLTAGTANTHGAPWPADRLTARIAELAKIFPFLLIDSRPVNLCAEIAVLGAIADGAILVIDAESTRREVALQAKEALITAKLRLLGAALNKRTFPIPEFVYRRV